MIDSEFFSSPEFDQAHVLTIQDLRDAMWKLYTERRPPCGSKERPHTMHPRFLDGPCLDCGAQR